MHPQKKKAIRGLKLGNNYTKKEIDIVIETNRNGNNGNAVGRLGRTGVRETKRGIAPYDGQSTVEIDIDHLGHEMLRLDRQNTLIEDLTITVKSLDGANARNARDLKESVSSAVVEIKSFQAETRSLNNRVATETSNAIKRATTTSENELRKTIQMQSAEVFAEVKKELDESKKLLESTREELKVERGFRKFLFWATPILLLAQTIAIIITSL